MTRASAWTPAGLPHVTCRLSPAGLLGGSITGGAAAYTASGEARGDAPLPASSQRGDRRPPVTRPTGPRPAGRIRPGLARPIRAGVTVGYRTGGGRRPGETYAPAPRHHPGAVWARVPIGRPPCPTC